MSQLSSKAVKEGGSVVTITERFVDLPKPKVSFKLNVDGEYQRKLEHFLESRKVKPLVDPKGPFPFDNTLEALAYLGPAGRRGIMTTGRDGSVLVDHHILLVMNMFDFSIFHH